MSKQFLWTLCLIAASSSPGYAIVTSDAVGTHRTRPGVPAFGVNLNGVGIVAGIPYGDVDSIGDLVFPKCSASLITDRQILTAAHCFDSDWDGVVDDYEFTWPYGVAFELPDRTEILRLNSGSGDLPVVHFAPAWVDGTARIDLAIVDLLADAPPDIPRYPLYSGSREIGKPFVLAGYGNAGYGPTGKNSIWDEIPTKRAGLNRFEDVTETITPGTSSVVFDFDSGSDANNSLAISGTPSDLGFGLDEAFIANGDSGGPELINGVIAAINSIVFQLPKGDYNNRIDFSWGEGAASARVSGVQDFIRTATHQRATFVEYPFSYGDIDFDQDVDSADLLMFLGKWTGALEPGTGQEVYEGGDSDTDGDVDSADMLVFLSQWTGAAAAEGTRLASVPEPGGLLLLGLAFGGLIGDLRRRERGR